MTFSDLDRGSEGFVSRAEGPVLVNADDHDGDTGRSSAAAVSLEAYDIDRDGYLNRSEAAVLLGAHGGAAAFDRYDTNGDGFLSRAELDGLLQQRGIGGTGGQPGTGSLGGTR